MDSRATGTVESDTLRWLEEVVVGLDLCPFAAEPYRAGRVRVAVSLAATEEALFEALMHELATLDRAEPAEHETTLLVHPRVLLDFEAFNQFLGAADLALERSGLVGTIQIASFHPAYRFAGVPADDPANATNRSPHPMLHLLRESSVGRAVGSHPDPSGIPLRNAARLRGMEPAAVARLLRPRGRRPA